MISSAEETKIRRGFEQLLLSLDTKTTSAIFTAACCGPGQSAKVTIQRVPALACVIITTDDDTGKEISRRQFYITVDIPPLQ